jgi:hypothetical protein
MLSAGNKLKLQRPKSLVAFVAFAVLVVAFFAGGLGLAEARKAKSKAAKADSADCKKDSDCVAVIDDCCPCSEGGKQHAIPKKEKETYEKDRKKRCKDTACTEAVSNDPTCAQVPICAAGICELGEPSASP